MRINNYRDLIFCVTCALCTWSLAGQIPQVEVIGPAAPDYNFTTGVSVSRYLDGIDATFNAGHGFRSINNAGWGYAASQNGNDGFFSSSNGGDGFHSSGRHFHGFYSGNDSVGIRVAGSYNEAAIFENRSTSTFPAVEISHGDDADLDLKAVGVGRIAADNEMIFYLNHGAGAVGAKSLQVRDGTGNSNAMILFESGYAEFGGVVCASGFSACSDIRYKKDIIPLTHSLENISQIRGTSYHWDHDKFPGKFNDRPQIGFIAQELEEIYPEMVHTNEEGYKSIDYSRMTVVLVEAVKELKKENDHLRIAQDKMKNELKRLAALEDKIDKLLNRE